MAETSNKKQVESTTSTRIKPKRESVLRHTFAASRNNQTGADWDDDKISNSNVLQRQCVCGTHTIAGGECNTCRQKRESNLFKRTAINSVTQPFQRRPHSNSRVLEASSINNISTGITYDFSQIPGHASEHSTVQPKLEVGAQEDKQEKLGGDKGKIKSAAAKGTSGRVGRLPYGGRIQKAFGKHDISGISSYQGSMATEACGEMGAKAYAHGGDVVFGHPPSLHTAAHEATHVVQQRSGIQLTGEVGKAGDTYEKHANAVADTVVSGGSAEALLDQYSGSRIQKRDGSLQVNATQVQMDPTGGVAIAGLVVAIIAAVTSATAVGYSVYAAQNDQQTGGVQRILSFGAKYFVTSLSQGELTHFAETLIRKNMDELDPGWQTRDESSMLTVAKTRAQSQIQRAMARKVRIMSANNIYWWKGDDTRGSRGVSYSPSDSIPTGWVRISVYGSELTATDFPGLAEAARTHSLDVSHNVPYLERVIFDGNGNTGKGIVEDDQIFVRPGQFTAGMAAGGIAVTGMVLFDWDDNTTIMRWDDSNEISLNNIPNPHHENGPPNT